MDLQKLYEEIKSATQDYQEGLKSVDDRVKNTTIELGEVMERLDDPESYIEREKQTQQEKIIGKYESKIAESLNEFTNQTEHKIQKLKGELNNDTDYQRKAYKATLAGQALNMLDKEQIPSHFHNIEDRTEREEFAKLAKIKLQNDHKLQKELNKNLVESLPEDERNLRAELAYNKQLLNESDYISNKAIQAAEKVINSNLGGAHKLQTIDNLSHSFGKKNDGIKNKLDDMIAEQF